MPKSIFTPRVKAPLRSWAIRTRPELSLLMWSWQGTIKQRREAPEFPPPNPTAALDDVEVRFYSTLKPEYKDVDQRREYSYYEWSDRNKLYNSERVTAALLPGPGESKASIRFGLSMGGENDLTRSIQEMERGQDRGVVRYRAEGFPFTFTLTYGFSLSLHFALNDVEASRLLKVARMNPMPSSKMSPSLFHRLPLEIRQKVYSLVIGEKYWFIGSEKDRYAFRIKFPGSMGDFSGFFYPIRPSIWLLHVNKQVRAEALPFAYRQTEFDVEQLNHAVQLLVGIGRIGRENIKFLHLHWKSEKYLLPTKIPEEESDPYKHLHSAHLHAAIFVQLLKQCRVLQRLRLEFEFNEISKMPLDQFTSDPGIVELCSVERITEVIIQGRDGTALKSVDECSCAVWLKETLEVSKVGKISDGESGEVDDHQVAE
ncbi:hypothetical protein PT974_00404 [Cladobotryum mycophilum]|uniref:Uncharacterized protein n=1 Tax=Cladobotryum mycophilum TaxID=491253 RepID=A0ABR0T0Z7_9HYPO